MLACKVQLVQVCSGRYAYSCSVFIPLYRMNTEGRRVKT